MRLRRISLEGLSLGLGSALLFVESGTFLFENVQESLGTFQNLHESALSLLNCPVVFVTRRVLFLKGNVDLG